MNISDEWETPKHIYEAISRIWRERPNYDTFASRTNTKCPSFFGLEPDNTSAFDLDWVGTAVSQNKEPVFWMNPPYSQPIMTQAIQKAIEEARKGGVTLFLLPAWVDQAWYHDLIEHYPHKFWRGRIAFIPPAGVKPSTPRYGSIHGVIHNLGISKW